MHPINEETGPHITSEIGSKTSEDGFGVRWLLVASINLRSSWASRHGEMRARVMLGRGTRQERALHAFTHRVAALAHTDPQTPLLKMARALQCEAKRRHRAERLRQIAADLLHGV